MSPLAAMDLSGRIEDRALPTLLVQVQQHQATGMLRIDSRTGRHEVFFREGQPVSVTLPGSAELIGKVLVEMGLLDEATHRQTLASPPPPGVKYGDLLIQQKLVTIDQVKLALKAQVRRKLHRLFFLNDGAFSFDAVDHQNGIFRGESLKVQPGRAIYQGVRSAWSAERLSNSLFLLSGQAFRCSISSEDLVRYGLGAHDAQIGEVLRRGFYTIESLTQATKAPQQPLLSLVYALYVTSALEIKPATTVKVETATVALQQNPAPSTQHSGPHRIPTPNSGVHARPQASQNMPVYSGTPLDAMRSQITAKAKVVDKEDLFQVLGLPDGASPDAVKTAYFDLAKKYHPDRIATQGLESQRNEVELIFRRVNEAYSTLSNEDKRIDYLKRRADGSVNPEDQMKAMQIVEADNSFRRGEVFLRKNDMNSALREFGDATQRNPQEGEYLAFLVWTKLCMGTIKHAEAKPLFLQSIKLAPRCGKAHYFLGLCYKEENDLDRALNAFTKAVQYDQRLIEAEREMRLIHMRRKDSGSKSILDKLRGK